MSITASQARQADEFHVAHSGLLCTIWRRSGGIYPMPADGWMIFIENPETGDWGHLTDIAARDWHTPADCPRRVHEDRPPGSHTAPFPALDDGYDEDGYDADGYDRDGYDADGYDADGYDRDGCNADGYSRDTMPGDLDLYDLWQTFRPRSRFCDKQEAFREHVREMLPGCPDAADDLAFCANCAEPAWNEDLRAARDDTDSICPSCWDDWMDCGRCGERYPDDDLNSTLDDTLVCDRCLHNHYSWCEDCDGYYDGYDAGEHDHSSSGDDCCESPQPEFTIRNDGCEPLANDTRVTITLPAGTISAEGLLAIREYLVRQRWELPGIVDLAYGLEELGDQWQTRQGNFTRRLSRLAFKSCQLKLPSEVLSQVGCIAADHSKAVDVAIEITRDLNMSAADFYHDDSCWWGSYSESRCALKTNGGFGLRSFSGPGDWQVSGRAWVMPLRQDERGRLDPTFETMTPDAFVVFNGYGDLSGYAPARIMAHMAGWTYRKIGFSCDPMYVNAGGYLIAPEEITEKYADRSLRLSVDQHSSLFRDETVKELARA
jgi:hypothetical protein